MSRRKNPVTDGAGYVQWSHRGLTIRDTLPWTWPWLVATGAWPLAALLYLVLGRDPRSAPWAAAGITLVAAVLTAVAYRAGRARGPMIREAATLAVAAGCAWTLWATLAAPWSKPVWVVWLFLLFVGPGSATIMRLLRGQGDDGASGWDELAAAVKLPGSRVMAPKRNGHTITATVQAAPGQTQEDVLAAAPRIAAAVGTPVAGARATPDPDHAGRATLTLVTRDLLRNPIPWAGLSAPGGSIIEPVRVGVRESGSPLQLWLPADERRGRSAQHVIVTGQTGSGKSVFGRIFLGEVLSRVDVEVWLIDLVKGRQFTGPFIGRVARLGTSEADAKQMIAALPALIAQRADDLGARGLDNWTPGCGMPYLVVHVEEAATAVAKSREIVTAMQTGRSAGATVLLSQQRVAHTAMPVDARQQAGTIFQFGCRKGDQGFALSPATLDAGAMPQAWGNSRPGMVYAETPGSAPEEWSSPARVEMATAPEIAAALGATPADGLQPEGEAVATVEPALAFRPADAQRELRSALAALRRAGHQTVRPADLNDVREAVGRSPAWMTGQLRSLVDEGELADAGHGLYRLV